MSDTKQDSLLDLFKKKVRTDGWINILTGLGMKGRDKRMSAEVRWMRMDERDAEELYAGDDLAGRMVDKVVDAATREWIGIKAVDKDEEENILKAFDEIDVRKKFNHAAKWARTYGGAALLIGTDDTIDLSEPLDATKVNKITSLTLVNRWELQPQQLQGDIRQSNYGLPEIYGLALRGQGGAQTDVSFSIHHTRVIRFDGVPLPRTLFIENNYWGDSILNKTKNAIRNYNAAHDSVASVIQDFRVSVLKVKDLAQMISGGDDQLVMRRLELVNMGKSIARTIVLDESEDFSNQTTALTGLKDVLESINGRVVAASGMPHTIVLGESADGMNATGEHDQNNWYDVVTAYQEDHLYPQLEQLFKLMQQSKQGPTNGKIIEGAEIEFKPLWQMDDSDKALIRFQHMQTDTGYIAAGVLDPSEVATSRFGGDSYGDTITLADEERDVIPPNPEMEQELEDTKNQLKATTNMVNKSGTSNQMMAKEAAKNQPVPSKEPPNAPKEGPGGIV